MAANTIAAIVRFFKDCRLYGCSASVRAVAVPRCCCRIFPAMPAVLACPVIGAGLKVCGNEGFCSKKRWRQNYFVAIVRFQDYVI